VGQGWDEAAFLPSGQPTRQMLDAVVPDRPVPVDMTIVGGQVIFERSAR
jgi:predicted amidohydrolase YtcJ